MKKDVELVIRARDEASRAGEAIADVLDRLTKSARNASDGSKDASNGFDILGAALSKVQSEYRGAELAGKSFESQTRALNATIAQQNAIAAKIAVNRTALAEAQMGGYTQDGNKKQLAAEIRDLEAAYAGLISEQQRLASVSEKQASALGSGVVRQAAAEHRDLAQAAAQIRAELYPADAAQQKLNADMAIAIRLYNAGQLSAKEYADQLRRLKADAAAAGNAVRAPGGRGDKSNVSLLGLKPYELQNLTYQINDVFTQLASGTSVTQTLAQQGGQLVQIFAGRNGGSFFAAIAQNAKAAGPWVALLAVTVGTLFSALKNVADLAKSEKTFSGQLAASADGGLYDAEMLAASAHELDVLAGSLKEARGQVSALAREDVLPGKLEEMAITARNFAEIYGKEVVDATKEVGKAFTGNFKEIDELDKAYNFLSKAQRDHVKDLFEQKKAEEARAYAFDIFQGKMNEGAAQMRGPWKEALQGLSQAWDSFLKWLGNSDAIQTAIRWLKDLAGWAVKATNAMIAAQNRGAIARSDAKIADLEEELQASRGRTGQGGMPRGRAFTRKPADTRLDAAKIEADLAVARAERAKLKGESEGPALTNVGSEADLKDADRTAESGAAKAAREADRAAREAEAAQAAREAAEERLSNALASLESKVGRLRTAPLDDRLAAIDKEYKKIQGDIEDARSKGVTSIDGMSLADYEKRVEANKVLLKDQAEMLYYTDALKDLEDQRSARLKTIQDQIADGMMSEEAGLAALLAVDEELAPAMKTIASDALLFARALYEAKPNPELARFIAQMERTSFREATPGGRDSETADAQLSQLARVEQAYGRVISARSELIATAQAELDRGLITVEQFEARVQEAYAKTDLALQGNISVMRGMVEALRDTGAITSLAYDAWIAKLDRLGLELENTQTQVLTLGDANAMLADAGVGAWNQFFDAIEEGQNVLSAFIDSMRQMLSDIFRDIAQIIIRAMIMRALMKTGLGKLLSGGVNGIFDAEGAISAAGALAAAGGLWKTVVAGLHAAAAELSAAGSANGAANAAGGGGSGGWLSTAASFLGSLFGGGGGGGAAASAHISAGLRHSGGIAGGGGPTRNVALSAFANAVRYHGGGLPGLGLRSNEIATILEDDEEVLARTDPRHAMNGGGGGGGSTKVLNVLDGPDLLQHALGDERGQKVLINYVRQNPGAFKAAMGVP